MKDKSKQPLTGSNTEEISTAMDEIEENLESIEDLKINAEEVEEMLQRLLDADWSEEVVQEMCTPSYMLSLGKDVEYLYSISRKTFVPVKNNIEVIPISSAGLPPESASLLKNYYTVNNEIFDIDPSKVVCIGWN